MFAHQAGPCSHVRSHAITNVAIIIAALLTWGSGTMWPDVLAGLGILYMNADAAEHIWLAARHPPQHELKRSDRRPELFVDAWDELRFTMLCGDTAAR